MYTRCVLCFGARQVGKTTLAQIFVKEMRNGNAKLFDLEKALDIARLENPMLALSSEPEKLIVIE